MTTDIPLDKAELLSMILESILYGFSLLMFGATVWTLFTRRSTRRVNYTMLTVACALLLCSSAHLVIHTIRVMEGLILYPDTYPGGPNAFFSSPSQWTFVSENFVYTFQTMIADGVILYRCYIVWQSKCVMIFPILLWCSVVVTGIASPYETSRAAKDSAVFDGTLENWITAFWVTALATNVLATTLLASRIWYLDRRASALRGSEKSQLRPIVRVVIDAGVIYSLSVFVALVCYVCQSNGQYVILDMVTPIISITFYMVIIRVGLAQHAIASSSRTTPTNLPLECGSTSAERRRTMQVHVTRLTESKVDGGKRSSGMYGLARTSLATSVVDAAGCRMQDHARIQTGVKSLADSGSNGAGEGSDGMCLREM